MAASVVAIPNYLNGAGFLFIAPIGSTGPTNTVIGGVFSDTWPITWLPLGATKGGTEFNYSLTTAAIEVEEYIDRIATYTTGRAGSVKFSLANWGATNAQRAVNGGAGAVTATSGATTTALYTVTPPAPGSEVRVMIGYESLDSTYRFVAPQVFQGGAVQSKFDKAADVALKSFEYEFELPSTGAFAGKPFVEYFAGSARG